MDITIETREQFHSEAQATISRVARTFSLASRLLPPAVRADVNLLYLIARTLDDAVDDGDPRAAQMLSDVERWATGGEVRSREAAMLEQLAGRHPDVPRDALIDFCAGQRQDLGKVSFATECEVDLYCYRVAGTVGRVMAAILGSTNPEAHAAARALGIAMQRTNILRDIDEELAAGRVYVPQGDADAGRYRRPRWGRSVAAAAGRGRDRRVVVRARPGRPDPTASGPARGEGCGADVPGDPGPTGPRRLG
ncbi:MAG: squalene/phytoene synthase family protein [Candidatus Dormibacteraeota bacterium]|nr:squalene/phytoene synthase family protein [Candidatus Dormibacteraeota bacterium]